MAVGRWHAGVGQHLAFGHAELQAHQVGARGLFRHRVFHLQTGVDFEERDRAALAQQILHRARAHIARRLANLARRLVDALALRIGQKRGRGLFHQLLVAALQRAIAGAQHAHIAVLVGHHLGFNVPRLVEELLDKAFATAKGGHGLAHRGAVQLVNVLSLPHHLQATATAAKCGFHRNRQAVFAGKGVHLGHVFHRLGRTRYQRRAHRQRQLARLHLVTQLLNRRRRWADPGQARVNHCAGKARVFRQKAVAGVHGIRPAMLGHRNQLVDAQIGLGRALAVQRIGLVGHAHMQRIDIVIGIDRHALQTVVGAGANNPNCDLAAISNQYFFHSNLSFQRARQHALRFKSQSTCTSAKGCSTLNCSHAPTGTWPARSRWCDAMQAMTG